MQDIELMQRNAHNQAHLQLNTLRTLIELSNMRSVGEPDALWRVISCLPQEVKEKVRRYLED